MAHGIGKSRAFRIIRELKGAGYLRVNAPRKRSGGTQTGWWYDLASRPGEFPLERPDRSGALTLPTPPHGDMRIVNMRVCACMNGAPQKPLEKSGFAAGRDTARN